MTTMSNGSFRDILRYCGVETALEVAPARGGTYFLRSISSSPPKVTFPLLFFVMRSAAELGLVRWFLPELQSMFRLLF
jgi:hypothetical protein